MEAKANWVEQMCWRLPVPRCFLVWLLWFMPSSQIFFWFITQETELRIDTQKGYRFLRGNHICQAPMKFEVPHLPSCLEPLCIRDLRRKKKARRHASCEIRTLTWRWSLTSYTQRQLTIQERTDSRKQQPRELANLPPWVHWLSTWGFLAFHTQQLWGKCSAFWAEGSIS